MRNLVEDLVRYWIHTSDIRVHEDGGAGPAFGFTGSRADGVGPARGARNVLHECVQGVGCAGREGFGIELALGKCPVG